MKPDAGSGVPIAVSQVDLQQAATAVGSAGKAWPRSWAA